MDTLHRFKEPTARLVGGFLMALQALMGMPFLLTMVGSVRHWGGWFNPRGPK